jgi:hypothetical protein
MNAYYRPIIHDSISLKCRTYVTYSFQLWNDSKQKLEKDFERCDLFEISCYSISCLEGLEIQWVKSHTIAVVSVEILNEDIRNMKQESRPLYRDVWWPIINSFAILEALCMPLWGKCLTNFLQNRRRPSVGFRAFKYPCRLNKFSLHWKTCSGLYHP